MTGSGTDAYNATYSVAAHSVTASSAELDSLRVLTSSALHNPTGGRSSPASSGLLTGPLSAAAPAGDVDKVRDADQAALSVTAHCAKSSAYCVMVRLSSGPGLWGCGHACVRLARGAMRWCAGWK